MSGPTLIFDDDYVRELPLRQAPRGDVRYYIHSRGLHLRRRLRFRLSRPPLTLTFYVSMGHGNGNFIPPNLTAPVLFTVRVVDECRS
jgi:hypothetical protein